MGASRRAGAPVVIALLLRFAPHLAVLAFVAASLFGAYAKGRNDERDAWKLKVAEQREQAAEREREMGRAIGEQGRRLEESRNRREAAARTIVKEIEHYVPMEIYSPEARACARLPGGWRLLHDAAAAGVPPAPLPEPGAPVEAGPTPTDSIRAVVGNYRQCLAWRDQVIGWQEWYETVSKGR